MKRNREEMEFVVGGLGSFGWGKGTPDQEEADEDE